MKSTRLFMACALAASLASTPADRSQAGTVQVDESQAAAARAGDRLVGRPVEPMVFSTLAGDAIRLGVRRSRPIYLKFWATWCTTCRAQVPAFIADFARYSKDIDFVAVDIGVEDDRKAVEAYRRQLALPMPVAIDDGRLAQAFHLVVTPQHVVIGRDGVVRYVGHLEDDQLHAALDAAVADAPVRPSRAASPGPAPGTRSISVQGTAVALDGPADGPARLLYFMSPWCETYLAQSRPAVAQACRQTRDALEHAADAGAVRVIGIASGLSTDADGVRRYLDRTGSRVPIVLDADGALFRRFGIRDFPAVVRLDAAGRPAGRPTLDALRSLAPPFLTKGRLK